jgi:hypothetical protein
MEIPKRTALAMSGLVFTGMAALTVVAATPASADWRGHHSRNAQSVHIFNKNFNFSRSDNEQFQHENQRQHHNNNDFRFDRFERRGE